MSDWAPLRAGDLQGREQELSADDRRSLTALRARGLVDRPMRDVLNCCSAFVLDGEAAGLGARARSVGVLPLGGCVAVESNQLRRVMERSQQYISKAMRALGYVRHSLRPDDIRDMQRVHDEFRSVDLVRSWTRWVQVQQPPAQAPPIEPHRTRPAPPMLQSDAFMSPFDAFMSPFDDDDLFEDDELDP
jgi:hypothetical protein